MQKLFALLIAMAPGAAHAQEGEMISAGPSHPRVELRASLGMAQAHVLNGRALRNANPSHTFSAGFSPVLSANLRYTPQPQSRLFFSTGASAWFVNAGPNLQLRGDNYEMHARFRQTTMVLAIPLRVGLHITEELDVEAGVSIAANFPSRGMSASAGLSSWGTINSDTSYARLETPAMDAVSGGKSYTSTILDVQASHSFGRRWFVSLRGAAQLGDGRTVQSSVSLTTGSPTAAPQIYEFSGRPRLAWISASAGMRIF